MLTKNDLNNFIPIVLCAGFGTRLKPLTNYIPKVVCPIVNKPAAFLSIEIFLKAGFEKVHCNTHYLNNEVRNELIQAAKYFGYDSSRIIFWHEEKILETGGGISRIYHELLKKENFRGKDAIVVSGDIIADFPLEFMLAKWKKKHKNDFALMCTKETPEIRKDATWVSNNEKYVLGFGENFDEKENAIAKVFTNHQIISQELLNCVEIEKKSSIDIYYRRALSIGKNILNLPYPNKNYWFDIGTPKSYLECINFFEKNICSNLDKNFYYHKNIINYCFNIPKNLKELIYLASHHEDLDKLSQTQIIIAFREISEKNQTHKLIPLNILNQFNDTEKSSNTNEFSILI
jgi:NDP-sugar pyrophosphorylase family protein